MSMSKPPKTWFWGPSWPRFSRPLEVLKLPEGVLGRTWDVFRPPLSPKNATLNTISNYSKKNLKKPPPKNWGRRHGNVFSGGKGKRPISWKMGSKPRVFAIFWKQRKTGPGERGIWGFPNDFFDVMQGSIYADILCIALAHNVRCNIYKTEVISDESKTLRGDPTRRYRQAERCRGAFCWASLLPPRLHGIASVRGHRARMGIWQSVFS